MRSLAIVILLGRGRRANAVAAPTPTPAPSRPRRLAGPRPPDLQLRPDGRRDPFQSLISSGTDSLAAVKKGTARRR